MFLMSQTLVNKKAERITRRDLPRLFVAMVTILFILPACGSAKDKEQKDEDILKNAAVVLQEMLGRNDVAPYMLARAKCIVVLPDVKKFGVGLGGSRGRGAMTCRKGKNFDGLWSAPALYSIGGSSIGLQLGGSSTDFVLLVTAEKGMEALLKGKAKLGSDASVAAGPSGSTTTSGIDGSDILGYGRTKGLYAGVALGGATVEPDDNGNRKLYGREISAREIVLGNAVQSPAAGQPLISLTNSIVAKSGK
jgi:lipid-binding SYLF domain-containing protein